MADTPERWLESPSARMNRVTVTDANGIAHEFPRDKIVRLPPDDTSPPDPIPFERHDRKGFNPTGPTMPERWTHYGDPGQARTVAAVNNHNIRGDLVETLARVRSRSPFNNFAVTPQPWANRPRILRKPTPIQQEHDANAARVCDREIRRHNAKRRPQ